MQQYLVYQLSGQLLERLLLEKLNLVLILCYLC